MADHQLPIHSDPAGRVMAAVVVKGDAQYEVLPLTVQPEGDVFLVGNPQLGAFYQFPPEAVDVLDRLRSGATPDDIARELHGGSEAEALDVAGFIATLEEIGFAWPAGRLGEPESVLPPPRTMKFSANPRTAKRFFSPAAVAVYVSLTGAALVCAIRFPIARLHADAFFVEDNLVATLLLLFVLSSAATCLHEFGHLIAAARRGVASRLGMGTRLWNLVMEADLSGIFALPRSQRYLPLAAGMMVDLLVISALTVMITTLYLLNAPPFPLALLQALVLQITITVLWQFNLFLRTDVYFILSNWSGHPNLDGAARSYIANKVHFFTGGRFGRLEDEGESIRFKKTVRVFVFVWVLGRILSLAALLFVIIPTLFRYAEKAWHTISDPASSAARILDAALFAGISTLLVAVGLLLWLMPKFRNRRSGIPS